MTRYATYYKISSFNTKISHPTTTTYCTMMNQQPSHCLNLYTECRRHANDQHTCKTCRSPKQQKIHHYYQSALVQQTVVVEVVVVGIATKMGQVRKDHLSLFVHLSYYFYQCTFYTWFCCWLRARFSIPPPQQKIQTKDPNSR